MVSILWFLTPELMSKNGVEQRVDMHFPRRPEGAAKEPARQTNWVALSTTFDRTHNFSHRSVNYLGT